MHRTSQVLLSSIIVCCAFVFALPTHAAGNYYALADAPGADDSNSCRTADDPCATLTGAINQILASADPSDATIYARGTFTERLYTTSTELNGLTLTWYEEGNRPVIDGTGYAQAVMISGPISDFTMRHFDISGSSGYGVYVYGTSYSHHQGVTLSDLVIHDLDVSSNTHYGLFIANSDDVLIKNVNIESLGSTTVDTFTTVAAIGMYISSCDRVTVRGSEVHDLVTSLTSAGETSLYTSISGISAQEADDLVIKNNDIYNLTSVLEADAATADLYTYIYGVYLYNNMDGVVRGNNVHDLSTAITANGDSSDGANYITGIYGALQNRTVVRANTLSDFSDTFTVQDDEFGTPSITGIVLTGMEENVVRNNTITNIESRATNGSSSAQVIGLDVADVAFATIHHNTITNMTADGVTSGGTNRAIRLGDTPKANIYHNRIGDFTASGSGTTSSTGVEIGYNASVDFFNNAIYFSEATDQDNADAITIISAQADPVRIYHNTFSGMLTCLDLDNWGVTKFMNNLCYMTDGGAYGVEVTSDGHDLSTLKSNNNAFFNETGVLSFNDTSEGVLTLSDWRHGIYNQDEKSTKKNPHLNLDNPDGAKYLHQRNASNIKNAGRSTISFGSDSAMNALLHTDWDGQERFGSHTPDPGFDEYRK
jgi:hypothetical protein